MKSPPIMYAYAAFLLLCGFTAFAMAGFEMRAVTALAVGGGMAVVMAVCGIMAAQIATHRKVGMIGIHAGLVLPLLFAVLLAHRAYATFSGGDEEKLYLAVILTIMAIGSLVAFVALLLTRPKPEARL